MVKHGKDKKRRAGRTGRTQLKNKNFRRWDPHPKVGDSIVKKHWDASKSPAKNLKSMGLLAKPNDIHAGSKSSVSGNPSLIELFDIPNSDNLNKPKQCPLDEEDQKYIVRCMAKYGDDYEKMFKDTKNVNKMQYTENQLQKMGARFLLLSPDQRTIDLPAKVSRIAAASS